MIANIRPSLIVSALVTSGIIGLFIFGIISWFKGKRIIGAVLILAAIIVTLVLTIMSYPCSFMPLGDCIVYQLFPYKTTGL